MRFKIKRFNKKRVLILLSLTVIFFSCTEDSHFKHNRKILEFSENEVNTGKETIKVLLDQYGIKGSDVHGLAHLRYGVGESSRKFISESVEGAGYDREGPLDMEGSTPTEYRNSSAGEYSNLQSSVNYDKEMGTRFYCDYLSFLILVDKKYQDKIPLLEKAFGDFILNKNRGDTLTILVRGQY